MVMGIPACCEKTRWDFFLFFDLVLRGELGEAPVPSPSPLKTPDAIAMLGLIRTWNGWVMMA